MVDVDNLSDAELRSKLLEFGFPVMPITGTTRKTMAKKLKMLLENRNKVGREGRRSLGRYSSEEESDSESRARKDKMKRATMAAPPLPTRRKPAKADSPAEVKTTRTMRIVQTAKDEFDTGSESDEVAEKYSPPKVSPRLPPSFSSASSAADAASDRINQIRSRLSQYSPPTYYTEDPLKEKENTPFLSNFTKRLSQLSESPKSASFDYKSDIIKENDVNGGTTPNATTRAYLNSYRASRGRPSAYDFKQTNQNIFKNNFVPFMVLVVAFLFFIVVAVVYLGIRSDTSLEVTAKIPTCVKSDLNSRRFVNCVLEGEGKAALRLLQVLKPELNTRAVRNKCDESTFKPYMTEDEIIGFITGNFVVQNKTKISIDLINIEVLSFFNPSWGLSVLQLDQDGAEFHPNTIAKDMDQVDGAKHKRVTALMARHPYIPWKCYFYNTVWAFLSIFTSILGGAAILYAINATFRYYKQHRMKEHEEEVAMVEQIIDILQTNANETEENYMVINHVRDMILPITERKSKQKLWKKAVKYVDENESRIRTEVQVVRGEPSEVWRWLGGANLSTVKNKSWQGQAFETQVGSVNSLPCSPTPCLKIRGMVEEGDRNTLAIKKAVLTKCAHQCRILHCAVDTNSNCVYLKCADQNDAAVAYRNLHGWWYAGNLVTVKYLRLERYMQRFPESPASGPPFLQ